MIIGIGTDLVDIRRIEKSLQKFAMRFETRVFTIAEQNYAKSTKNIASSYAKRFAAKIELNIGHFLIGEAVFIGLKEAIVKMRLGQARRSVGFLHEMTLKITTHLEMRRV